MPVVLSRRARLAAPVPAVRAARAAALVLAAFAVGACGDDDPSGPQEEPVIEFVRLTVTPPGGSAATYTVRTTGTPAVVQVRVGANAVQAAAFDASNQPIDLDDEFELRLVQSVTAAGVETALPAQFAFARNGTLTTTLTVTAGAPTPQAAVVRLFHKAEGHSDLDPSVQLQAVP